jgi:endonuclease/exonuclease/phosphatase family metal-dependent hydrolase
VNIEIISYNIRRDGWSDGTNRWRRRRDGVTGLLRLGDVIGLQEAKWRQLRDVLLGVPGHRWAGVGRDDGRRRGEFVPLLWRADRFEHREGGHFWLSSDPDRPGSKDHDQAITRMATWVRLRDRWTGARLFVVNTHLDHRVEAARLAGVDQIRTEIDRRAQHDAVVVLGDFNDAPGSATLARALEPAGGRVVLQDARAMSRTEPVGPEGTLNGWGRRGDGPRIDYVLCDSQWQVDEYRVEDVRIEGRVASDHHPVIVKARPHPLER